MSSDNRFHPESYEFVMESLHYAQRKLKRSGHISAKELLEAVKDLAQEKFGPLARMVLAHWGIYTCEDIGEVVFNMVRNKLLSKTPEDKKEDFKDVYDFQEVFSKGYQQRLMQELKKQIR